ncbi:hypothetical protein FF2_022705 [Malus domestica]
MNTYVIMYLEKKKKRKKQNKIRRWKLFSALALLGLSLLGLRCQDPCQQNPNHHNHVAVEKQNNIKHKKYKQPSSLGGRRRRRSSISHFRNSSTMDAKSVYSSSSSGFRTPPPYSHAQTAASKSYKYLRSYSDNHSAAPPAAMDGHAVPDGSEDGINAVQFSG